MNKLEAVEFIREKCKNENITAYRIGKAINKSAVGIQKILDGTVKNPNDITVDLIISYLKSPFENKEYNVNNTQNTVEESAMYYNNGSDLRELLDCKRKSEKLFMEVIRLQTILRKNNIDFDDSFEIE